MHHLWSVGLMNISLRVLLHLGLSVMLITVRVIWISVLLSVITCRGRVIPWIWDGRSLV